jgi:uncharacterized phage infection (PIP) family protein YhgE
MASQEELIVRIGADFDELKKGLKGAGDETEKFGKKAKKSTDAAGKALSSLAKKATALATTYLALGRAVDVYFGTISRSREVNQFSKRLGVTRERFSELEVITRSYGAQTEDLFDVFKDLNVRITDAANGAKAYDDVLKKIGLNSRILMTMSPEEQFLELADAVSKASDSLGLFAVDELVSDPGVRMIEVLKLGRTEINKMSKDVRSSGKSLREVDFKKLEAAAKAQRDLSMAFERFANLLATKVAPAVTAIMNEITNAKPAKESIKDLQEELRRLYTLRDKRSKEGGFFGKLWREEDLTEFDKKIEETIKKLAERVRAGQGTGSIDVTAVVGDVASIEAAAEEKMNALSELFMEEMRMVQDHEISLLNIKRRSEEEKTRIQQTNAEMRRKAEMTVAKGMFKNLSTLMGTENRKLFEIGKAASIANATISMYESATDSFKFGAKIGGPPLGAAFAATAVAAGLANINAIASTNMGGGGGGAAGAGGASGGVAQGATAEAPGNVIDATFNIEGSNVSKDSIRGVFNDLQEYIDDGATLRTVSVI